MESPFFVDRIQLPDCDIPPRLLGAACGNDFLIVTLLLPHSDRKFHDTLSSSLVPDGTTSNSSTLAVLGLGPGASSFTSDEILQAWIRIQDRHGIRTFDSRWVPIFIQSLPSESLGIDPRSKHIAASGEAFILLTDGGRPLVAGRLGVLSRLIDGFSACESHPDSPLQPFSMSRDVSGSMHSVAIGESHIVLVSSESRNLLTCGMGADYRLGNGSESMVKKPTAIPSFPVPIDWISSTDFSSLAVSMDHKKVYSFGANFTGQCGVGHREDVPFPTLIQLDCLNDMNRCGTVTDVDCGAFHCILLVNLPVVSLEICDSDSHPLSESSARFEQMSSVGSASTPFLIRQQSSASLSLNHPDSPSVETNSFRVGEVTSSSSRSTHSKARILPPNTINSENDFALSSAVTSSQILCVWGDDSYSQCLSVVLSSLVPSPSAGISNRQSRDDCCQDQPLEIPVSSLLPTPCSLYFCRVFAGSNSSGFLLSDGSVLLAGECVSWFGLDLAENILSGKYSQFFQLLPLETLTTPSVSTKNVCSPLIPSSLQRLSGFGISGNVDLDPYLAERICFSSTFFCVFACCRTESRCACFVYSIKDGSLALSLTYSDSIRKYGVGGKILKSSELTYFDGESDTIPTDFTAASLRQLSREQRNVHSRSAVLSFTADSMLDEPTNALNSINLFSATPLPKDSCQTSCVDACTQTESLSYPSSAQETNHLDLLLEVESLFSAESERETSEHDGLNSVSSPSTTVVRIPLSSPRGGHSISSGADNSRADQAVVSYQADDYLIHDDVGGSIPLTTTAIEELQKNFYCSDVQLREENEDLRLQLREMQARSGDLLGMERAHRELERELKQVRKENVYLRDQMKSLSDNASELTFLADTLRSANEQARTLEELRAELAETRHQLASSVSENEGLQLRVQDVMAQYEASIRRSVEQNPDVCSADLLLANEEQSDTCLATSSSGETIEVNSQSNVADIVVDCRLARRSRAQAALRRLEAKSNMSSGRLSPGLSEGETIPSTLASPRSDGDTACDVLEETVRPLVTLAINCPISVQCYPPPQVCVSIPVTVASVQSVVVENSSSLHLVPDPVISDVQSFSSEETLSNKEYLLSLDELDVELLSDVFGDIPVSRTENHSVSFSATHLTETEDDEPDVPLIRVDDDNHASTSLSLRIGSLSSSSDALFKLPSRSVEFGR